VERVLRVVLIGFSGTGKSTLAQLVAEHLGWTAADSDAEIERQWGVSIPAIFRDHGEAAFRASERSVLQRLLAYDEVVVAAGGGAAVDPAAWDVETLGKPGTLVVALDASPQTILDRLRWQAASEGDAVERPMLVAVDPLARVRDLKSSRQSSYDSAHLTLSSDSVSLGEVANEVAAVVRLADSTPLRVHLDAASGTSEIEIAAGALSRLGTRLRDVWPGALHAWIITDANIARVHAAAAEKSLAAAGIGGGTFVVPAGEGSKSLPRASELYDWLLGNGIERTDVVVALGGGVVGDLAGFVAATVLRGVGLIQVPTSLLAAVDSSVGGKTGINHAAGKNLIGAFLQPHLVLVDPQLLQTLPDRELRSGWAEVVKHAIIQRSTPGGARGDLRTTLERNRSQLRRLTDPALSYLIYRNIALKSAVVASDEREHGGRAFLNFGHTLGHAIEAAGYQLLHGEAIALGMIAAAELGVSCGTCGRAEADRIGALVDQFELPRRARLDERTVLALLGSDKKRAAGRQRFVLPVDDGGVIIRDDVPKQAVELALAVVNERRHAA
jgi:shikimate kinase/3-dehydroquinate synthase